MPEINERQMVEKTRQETHLEDTAQIKDFRDHSVSQKEFAEHCKLNLQTDHKLDKLMPLTELIPTLKIIVEDEKGKRWLAKRIVNFLKIAGIVIGSAGAIFWILWAIIKEFRK